MRSCNSIALWIVTILIGLFVNCTPSGAQGGTIFGDPPGGQRPTDARPQIQGQPSNSYYYIDAGHRGLPLGLRTDPITSSYLVMALGHGTRLQVLQRRDDGWWYVRVLPSGQQGWVRNPTDPTMTTIKCCAITMINPPHIDVTQVRINEAKAAQQAAEQKIAAEKGAAERAEKEAAKWAAIEKAAAAEKAIVERVKEASEKATVEANKDSNDAPQTQCDIEAAHPDDTRKAAPGKIFDQINSRVAISACQNSIIQYPTVFRFQFQLGRAYQAAEEFEEAYFWYRKIAEKGDARGQNNLGIMLENGRGVAKDYPQAVIWYRKAAEQGDASGQVNLGIMYEDGKGVAKDYPQAVIWYRKAAAQGNELAKTKINEIVIQSEYEENLLRLLVREKEIAGIHDNPFRRQMEFESLLDARKKLKRPKFVSRWVCNVKLIGFNAHVHGDGYNNQEWVGFQTSAGNVEYGIECLNRVPYVLVYQPTTENRDWLSRLSVGQTITFDGEFYGPRYSTGAYTYIRVVR